MKKILLTALMLIGTMAAMAQVPAASNPVCAECGGHEMAKRNGQWVELTPHKSWCPIAKKIEEAEAEAKADAWEPDFSITEFQYGNGVMCDECGMVHGHAADCGIGYCQKLAYRYTDTWRSKEALKRKMRILEENIRNFAQKGRERRAKQQDQSQTGTQPISTKLKDHTPMPEKNPSQQLMPEMAKMPRTELPTSIRMSNVRETSGPNDPTIYDKRIEFKDDSYKTQAVARCKTSQNGKEEWALFKKDGGEKLAGPFTSLFVTDQGVYEFFIAQDLNSLWGFYNKYGEPITAHEFTNVEPVKLRDKIGNLSIKFGCQRDGKWGLFDAISKKFVFPCEYDDVQTFPEDPGLVFLEKDGKSGLGDLFGFMEVPVQFTYVERMAIKNADTYYIVSQDNVNYGAYCNGYGQFPQQYTLGEIRQKVREEVADFLQRREKSAKEAAKRQKKNGK